MTLEYCYENARGLAKAIDQAVCSVRVGFSDDFRQLLEAQSQWSADDRQLEHLKRTLRILRRQISVPTADFEALVEDAIDRARVTRITFAKARKEFWDKHAA